MLRFERAVADAPPAHAPFHRCEDHAMRTDEVSVRFHSLNRSVERSCAQLLTKSVGDRKNAVAIRSLPATSAVSNSLPPCKVVFLETLQKRVSFILVDPVLIAPTQDSTTTCVHQSGYVGRGKRFLPKSVNGIFTRIVYRQEVLCSHANGVPQLTK